MLNLRDPKLSSAYRPELGESSRERLSQPILTSVIGTAFTGEYTFHQDSLYSDDIGEHHYLSVSFPPRFLYEYFADIQVVPRVRRGFV